MLIIYCKLFIDIICIANLKSEKKQVTRRHKLMKWSKKYNIFLSAVEGPQFKVTLNRNTQVKYHYLKFLLK